MPILVLEASCLFFVRLVHDRRLVVSVLVFAVVVFLFVLVLVIFIIGRHAQLAKRLRNIVRIALSPWEEIVSLISPQWPI
jgi:hypothetical protein